MHTNNIEKPVVIAEIGCNHMGNIEVAKHMIHVAKFVCDVSIVKFQKRSPRELLPPAVYNNPHPNEHHSFGKTYGEHREFLEFTKAEHQELKKYCEKIGIEYFTSVWDITSAKDIISLKPKRIKVPSASNLNFPLLSYLCDNFKGEIHISLGMTTPKEQSEIVSFLKKKKRNKDVVLYACTSGYPVPFEDVSLLEIRRLKKEFGATVKGIGFSGHHLGIAIDPVAYHLGAHYIERHFTLDRTAKGTDHAASLEPDGLRKLARNLKEVYLALQYKKKDILDIEVAQRQKLKSHQIVKNHTSTRAKKK